MEQLWTLGHRFLCLFAICWKIGQLLNVEWRSLGRFLLYRGCLRAASTQNENLCEIDLMTGSVRHLGDKSLRPFSSCSLAELTVTTGPIRRRMAICQYRTTHTHTRQSSANWLSQPLLTMEHTLDHSSKCPARVYCSDAVPMSNGHTKAGCTAIGYGRH